MRKRIAGTHRAEAGAESEHGWLDLEEIATVELTSEHPDFPIESALGFRVGSGWRASRKVPSRSGSYLINLRRYIGSSFVSMRPSASERRSSRFDGHLPPVGRPEKSCANNGISALQAQRWKSKIM